jgi:hypothetical protein
VRVGEAPARSLLGEFDEGPQVCVRRGSADEDVDMVGHEAVRKNFTPMLIGRVQKLIDCVGYNGRVREVRLAIVRAGRDEVAPKARVVERRQARRPGHGHRGSQNACPAGPLV